MKRSKITDEDEIASAIGKTISHPKKLEGVSLLLLERLKKENLRVREGFGYFDLIIDEKNTVAIFIIGKVKNEEYSLLDEYNYYYHQYQRNGWIVEVIYMSDLVDNFDSIVKELTKFRVDFKELCAEEGIVLPEVTIDQIADKENIY